MRLIRVLSCLALTILASACAPAQEPPLRIGTNIWPGYEPLYLARDLGFFADSGVRLVEMTSATQVIHALRNQTLEGAALTLDESLTLLDAGFDLKVILVMDISHGGDALVAKPEIASVADLKGRRVAVEYTAVGAILLESALHDAGLTSADIEIVACSLNRHLDCYSSIGAVVTFEPIRTLLLNRGAKILFDSSKIAGRILDVLVVRDAVTTTHAASLEQLLAGYFDARGYIETDPDDAAQRMSVRMGLTAEDVLTAYAGALHPDLNENHTLLGGNSPPLLHTAENLASFMLEAKLIKKTPTLDALIDNRFLPANFSQ